MKTLAVLPLLSLLAVFVGCAHQAPQQVVLTQDQMDRLNSEALELASQRLEKFVVSAKQEGPASVQYLSTGLFLKGNAALMEGDYVTGSMFFQHLVKLTDDPFVHKKYSVALIRMGELEKARDVLKELYEKQQGKDESVALVLAGVYTGLEKVDEARTIYRHVLTLNPKQEEACLFLGKSLAVEKKWGEAEKQLTSCQKHNPKSGIFSYYLGKMYVDRGDMRKALSFFKDSYQRDSSSTQAAAALGLVLEQEEKHEEAIRVYERHLAKKPHDAAILTRIVQALFQQERFQEVVPYAERLVDLDPEDLNMRVKLGILYTESQEFDKAISVFRELLQEAPGSDKILYYLGAIHQELEKFEDAIDYFAQIPTSSGLYQDSSFQMANMLSGLAQVEYRDHGKVGVSATRFLALSERMDKEAPKLKVELAVLRAGFFEALERDADAVQVLEQVKAEPEFGLQHQYYLAGLLEKVKRFDASTAIIMAILDKDPKNAHAWNFIGYSMLERGVSPEEALPYIQKAVAISPDDGYIRDSLGWYYFKTGRMKEALKELNAAYEKVPDDVVIAKHLALIHRDMKNFAQARTFLMHALKNAKLTADRREINVTLEALERERSPASKD